MHEPSHSRVEALGTSRQSASLRAELAHHVEQLAAARGALESHERDAKELREGLASGEELIQQLQMELDAKSAGLSRLEAIREECHSREAQLAQSLSVCEGRLACALEEVRAHREHLDRVEGELSVARSEVLASKAQRFERHEAASQVDGGGSSASAGPVEQIASLDAAYAEVTRLRATLEELCRRDQAQRPKGR